MSVNLQSAKQRWQLINVMCMAFAIGLCIATFGESEKMQNKEAVSLPTPEESGSKSVEATLAGRHSSREYSPQPLTLQQIAQLCWAATGETVDAVSGATRTYPSAGGIYPGELYVVAAKIKDTPSGIYRYDRRNNNLVLKKKGDFRYKISEAALEQNSIKQAPVTFIMTANTEKTAKTYGKRGRKLYIPIEAGCAAQNIHLQCESLQLGTVIIGAFQDKHISAILNTGNKQPLWIMPIGKPAR